MATFPQKLAAVRVRKLFEILAAEPEGLNGNEALNRVAEVSELTPGE